MEKHKPRLRRLDHLYTDHPLYFLTASTEDRKRILAREEVHQSFQAFARKASEHGIQAGRYVLMPDHAHFFAAFSPSSPSLSTWMKSWKNALSKTLRQLRIQPPHWEKDFFDRVLRSEESYTEKWLYVRENPVRAGLVKRAEDWPYQGEIHRLVMTVGCSGGL